MNVRSATITVTHTFHRGDIVSPTAEAGINPAEDETGVISRMFVDGSETIAAVLFEDDNQVTLVNLKHLRPVAN